jgi:hypothetical protein
MGDVLKLGPRDSLEILSSDEEELLVLASYVPLGSPPAAHLPPSRDERFEVLEGRMRAPARVRSATRPGLRTERECVDAFRLVDAG